MDRDRRRWNKKHRDGGAPTHPDPFLIRFGRLAPGKRALDIAAGSGRNSLWLADQGFVVDALDISEVGLGMFGASNERIRRVCVDLDGYDIRPAAYDLIVNSRFLCRRLFPGIIIGLRPRGCLVFQSYLDVADGLSDSITDRDHLLKPNELLRAFSSLHIIHYEEQPSAVPGAPFPLASLAAVRLP
jgi:SAM-dependent methyltransferase